MSRAKCYAIFFISIGLGITIGLILSLILVGH